MLARVLVCAGVPLPGREARGRARSRRRSPTGSWPAGSAISCGRRSPTMSCARLPRRGKLRDRTCSRPQTRRMLQRRRKCAGWRPSSPASGCTSTTSTSSTRRASGTSRRSRRCAATMYEESIRFFTDLFQHDGSVLEHPGCRPHVPERATGQALRHPGRAGPTSGGGSTACSKYGAAAFSAQATTLAKQSGASRTSPILRGNWISEVLLGERLPRPPKDVPRLPDDEAATTV